MAKETGVSACPEPPRSRGRHKVRRVEWGKQPFFKGSRRKRTRPNRVLRQARARRKVCADERFSRTSLPATPAVHSSVSATGNLDTPTGRGRWLHNRAPLRGDARIIRRSHEVQPRASLLYVPEADYHHPMRCTLGYSAHPPLTTTSLRALRAGLQKREGSK